MEANNFQAYINGIVEKWSRQLEQKLLAALLSEGLIDTGNLQQSLKAKVFGMVNNATSEMQLSFNSYGRVLDMKRSQKVPTHTNAHYRAALGVGRTLKDRGRAWYNKLWYKDVTRLTSALMGDVTALAHQDFLTWLKS